MSRLWAFATTVPFAVFFYAGCGSDGESSGGTDQTTFGPDASVYVPPGTGGVTGTGGFAATGGSSFVGTGGVVSGTGGDTSAGSCNAAFCPSSGAGTPCCMASNGPCGVDLGMGCTTSTMGPADGGP